MEGDEQAVRKVVNDFAETWNRHDMNALGALFAPNADFVNVGGLWWRGRQEIQTRHAFLHAAISQKTPRAQRASPPTVMASSKRASISSIASM